MSNPILWIILNIFWKFYGSTTKSSWIPKLFSFVSLKTSTISIVSLPLCSRSLTCLGIPQHRVMTCILFKQLSGKWQKHAKHSSIIPFKQHNYRQSFTRLHLQQQVWSIFLCRWYLKGLEAIGIVLFSEPTQLYGNYIVNKPAERCDDHRIAIVLVLTFEDNRFSHPYDCHCLEQISVGLRKSFMWNRNAYFTGQILPSDPSWEYLCPPLETITLTL